MTARSQAVTRVLVIDIRHPRVVRAARRAGLLVHYLGDRESAPDWLAAGADAVSLVDDPSPAAMLAAARRIHAEQPFGVAVAMVDTYVEVAAEINEVLGLHANGPAVPWTVNDKARMREVLRDSSAAAVVATRVGTADEVKGFAAEAGYPFVVKPVDGTGSHGVTLVRGEAELDDAVARTVDSAEETGGWVAEEYLSGPEFSVESFTANGVHHPLAVTEKFKGPNFVEIGHVVPARLPAETERAVMAEVTVCLDAIGMVEGPAHTEVVLTERGPRIVETHCRPAGDGIVELVRLATGLDLHQIIFDWLAGRALTLEATVSRAAATWFLTPGPGKVSSISGLPEARAAQGVTEAYLTVAPGDCLGELSSSFDRSGAVIAAGDTPEEALRRVREAVGLIEVTVEG